MTFVQNAKNVEKRKKNTYYEGFVQIYALTL